MSAAATTHSMGREPVRPDWPPFTSSELRSVLGKWDREVVAVEWRSPRPFSTAAVVRVSNGGSVFVKRHHRMVRSLAMLETEHAFGRHLSARGQPVAQALLTSSGVSAVAEGEWTYELQRPVTGVDRYRAALAWTPYAGGDAFGAGVALARFHQAAAGFAGRGSTGGILTGGSAIATAAEPMRALEDLVERRPGLSAWLAGRDWRSQVAPLFEPWPVPAAGDLWGHGDWHPTNLTWCGNEVAGIVDLGLAAPTGAEWDVAVAIERAVVSWLDLAEGCSPSVDRGALGALLAGYHHEAPLDLTEVARVLPLAHVDFALSEVEYFAAVTRSEANAALAWDGYLCGHLEWWSGPAGRSLIEEVKGAAST